MSLLNVSKIEKVQDSLKEFIQNNNENPDCLPYYSKAIHSCEQVISRLKIHQQLILIRRKRKFIHISIFIFSLILGIVILHSYLGFVDILEIVIGISSIIGIIWILMQMSNMPKEKFWK